MPTNKKGREIPLKLHPRSLTTQFGCRGRPTLPRIVPREVPRVEDVMCGLVFETSKDRNTPDGTKMQTGTRCYRWPLVGTRQKWRMQGRRRRAMQPAQRAAVRRRLGLGLSGTMRFETLDDGRVEMSQLQSALRRGMTTEAPFSGGKLPPQISFY